MPTEAISRRLRKGRRDDNRDRDRRHGWRSLEAPSPHRSHAVPKALSSAA